jgi:hypothetical protein
LLIRVQLCVFDRNKYLRSQQLDDFDALFRESAGCQSIFHVNGAFELALTH